MLNKLFKNTSNIIKIMNISLFITTILYILETIFIRGLFTNVILACANIVFSIVTLTISLIKKEYKLAIADGVMLGLVLSIFIYLLCI